MVDSPRRLETSHSSSFRGMLGGDNPDEFVARFQTTKISWKGKYERIFALSATRFCTIDPKDFDVTNSWPYQGLSSFELDLNDDHVFTLVILGPKKEEQLKLRYKHRAYLLTEFLRMHAANAQTLTRSPPQPLQCKATKLTRLGVERECILEIAADALVYKEVLPSSSNTPAVLERVPFTDIDHITPVTNSTTGCIIGYYGKQTVFFTMDRSFLFGNMEKAAARIGLRLASRGKLTLEQVDADKPVFDPAECIVQFPVQKFSKRHEKPERRILALIPAALLELDPKSLVVLSSVPLRSLFGLVRHPGSNQFEIEFVHGSHSRLYSCHDRDGVLAALYDSFSANNPDNSLEISSTPSQTGLRLLPRFAVEDVMESSSFFGDSSIGACFLKRLAAVGKYTSGNGIRAGAAAGRGLVSTAAEFNANVPLSGIQYHTKRSIVLEALKPLVVHFQTVAVCQPPAPRTAVTLLQCMCRIASSFYGFRELLHFPSVMDSLRHYLVAEDELTVLWTALLIQRLTMHTISSAAMPEGTDVESVADKRSTNGEAEMNNKRMLFGQDALVNGLVGVLGRFAIRRAGPLSLMGNLKVLEGAICSHRHTTDPANVRVLVDKLVPHYDSLTQLLFRSRCTTTVESCTLLVQAVLRLCSQDAAASIKDAALRQGLVLQHLYQSMFDPSFDQRCVSRYMITMWMSNHAPAKQLLRRIFPPGLVSCLEMRLLSSAEECQLDELEKTTFMDKFGAFNAELLASRRSRSEIMSDYDSFYDNMYESSSNDGLPVNAAAVTDSVFSSAKLLERMQIKSKGNVFDESTIASNTTGAAISITSTSRGGSLSLLKDGMFNLQMLRRAITLGVGADKPTQDPASLQSSDRPVENFRILFHMMQQDHETIELVWTTATREELHQALVHEIHQFRSYSIHGQFNVVWNYEDFSITYTTLENELVVDGLYLRHLLMCPVASIEAGAEDAWSPPLHVEDMIVKKPKRFVTALFKKILREQGEAEYKGHVEVTVSCLKALAMVAWLYEFEYHMPSEDLSYMLTMVELTSRHDLLVHLLEVLRSVTRVPSNAAKLLKDSRAVPLLVSLIQMAHISQRHTTSSRRAVDCAVWICNGQKKTMEDLQQSLTPGNSPQIHIARVRNDKAPPVPFGDIPQLKWEFGMDRRFEVVHVAHNAIRVLISLLKSNPLVTGPSSAAVYPLPLGKQLASTRLADIASLLVLHELPKLSELTMHVLVHLSLESTTIYMSGVFYLLFLYKGDAFVDFATFLKATHNHQLYPDSSPRRILVDLLPMAMIDQLDTLSPADFAALFCSDDVKTPRVIWNASMRETLWRSCLHHLDDFRAVLQHDVTIPYDYHPMPPVLYHDFLANELYCHGYCLRQFCDSSESVQDSLAFLTSLHAEWTRQVNRVAVGLTRAQAIELLEIDENVDDIAVRDAYKRLSRPNCPEHAEGHPDKLQRYDRIQSAYVVLTSPRESLLTAGYDAVQLDLILRAQIHLFKTCAPSLASSKLEALPLLLNFLATHCTHDRMDVPPLTSHAEQLQLTLLAVQLLQYACATSVHNIPHLLADNNSHVVDNALRYAVDMMIDGDDPTDEAVYVEISINLMQTMAGIASSVAGRHWILETDHVLYNTWRILWYYHSFTTPPGDALVVLVRLTLEALICMCGDTAKDAPLPEKIVRSGGILWHLLYLWYSFDSTVDEASMDARLQQPTVLFPEGRTSLREDAGIVTQAQTLLAMLAVRVIVAANKNTTIQAVCNAVLSPNLYFQSTNPSSYKFLHLFHRDTVSHRLIWTAAMRDELKAFLTPLVTAPVAMPTTSAVELAHSFRYTILKEQCIVDDVYIEPLYAALTSSSFATNSVDVVRQLGLSSSFYSALVLFLRTGQHESQQGVHVVVGWGLTSDLCIRFRSLALGILAALGPLATAQVEAAFTVMPSSSSQPPAGLMALFSWVLPPEHKFMLSHMAVMDHVVGVPRDAFAIFQTHALTTLHALATSKTFGDIVFESKLAPVLMHAALLEDEQSSRALEIVSRLCASSHAIARYITTSIWLYHLLIWMCPTTSSVDNTAAVSGMIMDGDCDYATALQIPSATILGVLGQPTSLVLEDVMNVLVRFLPVTLIYEIINAPQNVATILSGHYEAPDLVWNNTLRTHFYREMLRLVVIVNKCTDTEVVSDDVIQFDIEYAHVYPYPMVGDVYLLLYLENPVHPLRDPKYPYLPSSRSNIMDHVCARQVLFGMPL
ncbi:hypothetical protein, variant [Aphanomyces invadans]|uniref:J domain-containing protein n=1 Tax=Aphanomyces invadans TaxID=157072 RepID=A0A024UWM7_9STRA|nr:hypothetical protein, variant [Aphanomyces invadans]ETW10342.1 hypothetical protein, variant [Aphanomyces invadans]|eukprot:XP_008861753.1 hypothetical protein, variant [Aphanomyces invadans]